MVIASALLAGMLIGLYAWWNRYEPRQKINQCRYYGAVNVDNVMRVALGWQSMSATVTEREVGEWLRPRLQRRRAQGYRPEDCARWARVKAKKRIDALALQEPF